MRVLALDQSTKKTGYSIFINGRLVDYGLIDLSNISSNITRRAILKDKIINLIIKFNIEIVLYENIFARNKDTYNKLAKVQGMIEDLTNQLGLKSEETSSKHWRKALVNGKATKEDVKKYLLKKYKQLDAKLEQDVFDAIAIGATWVIENEK